MDFLLTKQQAAEALGIDGAKLESLIRTRKLPLVSYGGTWRIPAEAVADYMLYRVKGTARRLPRKRKKRC